MSINSPLRRQHCHLPVLFGYGQISHVPNQRLIV
jgi:hypothetical protein